MLTFRALVYANDTALLLPSVGVATSCLSSFSTAAAPHGLIIQWEKTKLQNLGSGPQPANISASNNRVESMDSFVYLGCLQSSSGQCRPDLKCHNRICLFDHVIIVPDLER